MSKRDYYEILGVTKTADGETIKKVYRQLAMKHHPDRNQGNNDAEIKFKEASEAYEVLGDPEKRARYDAFGHVGQRVGSADGDFGFSDIFGRPRWNNGNIPMRGEDVQITVAVELKDILNDIEKTLHISTDDNCTYCSGSGLKPGASKTVCKDCRGSGIVMNYYMNGNVRMGIQQQCGRCKAQGSSILTEHRCAECNNGKVASVKEAVVTIPAGMSSEYTLRVAQMGKLGLNGGPRGDVLLRVNVKQHEKLKRIQNNPNDLILELPISFVQSCLGDKVNVEMLDGSDTDVVIPPYSQNGHTVLLDGEGVPSFVRRERGNLWVRFNIQVPASVTNEQVELLKIFDEIEKGKNVYKTNPNAGNTEGAKPNQEKI